MLSYVEQLVVLPRRQRLRNPVQSLGQRLMVRQDVEFPGFQLETEVLKTQIGGQQLSIKCRVVELCTVQLPAEEC